MKKLIFILLLIPIVLQGQVIGSWDMNGNGNDGSGNGYNGTETNVSFTSYIFNQACNFTGSSSYITLPSLGTFNGASTFTMSAIIKPTVVNVAYQRIFNIGAADNSTKILSAQICLNNNKITAYVADNGITTFDVAVDPGTASAGVIYFIDATMDGNDLKLYKNGVLVATTAYSAGSKIALNNNANWYIGVFKQINLYYGNYNGLIEKVRLYNTALSPAQIKNKFSSDKGFYQ